MYFGSLDCRMPIITVTNHVGPTYALEPRAPTAASATLFRNFIQWNVVNAVDGYVVQHIQRNEKYWVQRHFPRHQTYQAVSVDDYWECWRVTVAAGVTTITPARDLINDKFTVVTVMDAPGADGTVGRFPDKTGTRGRWKLRGLVYFVADPGLVIADWPAGGAPSAGLLHSRLLPPIQGNGLARNRQGRLGGVLFRREFAGSWDWTTEDQRIAPRADDGVGAPPLVTYRDPVVSARNFPALAGFRSRNIRTADEAAGGWLPIARRPAHG